MSLKKDEDYYTLPDGRLVFTSGYLLRRGWCCGNGCLNCPFDYAEVPEPERTMLRSARTQNPEQDGRTT